MNAGETFAHVGDEFTIRKSGLKLIIEKKRMPFSVIAPMYFFLSVGFLLLIASIVIWPLVIYEFSLELLANYNTRHLLLTAAISLFAPACIAAMFYAILSGLEMMLSYTRWIDFQKREFYASSRYIPFFQFRKPLSNSPCLLVIKFRYYRGDWGYILFLKNGKRTIKLLDAFMLGSRNRTESRARKLAGSIMDRFPGIEGIIIEPQREES